MDREAGRDSGEIVPLAGTSPTRKTSRLGIMQPAVFQVVARFGPRTEERWISSTEYDQFVPTEGLGAAWPPRNCVPTERPGSGGDQSIRDNG